MNTKPVIWILNPDGTKKERVPEDSPWYQKVQKSLKSFVVDIWAEHAKSGGEIVSYKLEFEPC